MNTAQINVPGPVVREYRMRNGDGREITVGVSARGDRFNLSTGECTVARLIGGKRFDTSRAVLIAGTAGPTGIGGYSLRRMYCADHGGYFVLRMEWADDIGFAGLDFIQPVADANVLTVARGMIGQQDCLEFLRNWYCAGWIPRNDSEALVWGEATLSADECETIWDEIARAY